MRALAIPLICLSACDLAYPEVVVENAADVQIRSVTFNGCVWDSVVAYREFTSSGRCLPGEDRVHFERLSIDSDANGESGSGPIWFSYQTIAEYRVEYGGFYIFSIQLDGIEQDFSVPGPYGH